MTFLLELFFGVASLALIKVVAKSYHIQTVIKLSKNKKEPLHRNTKRRDNYLALKSVSM